MYERRAKALVILPSGHMTLIQRCLNVDATSRRCIDVEPTLYKHHVPAGFAHVQNDLKLRILRKLEGTFSLDTAHINITVPHLVCWMHSLFYD